MIIQNVPLLGAVQLDMLNYYDWCKKHFIIVAGGAMTNYLVSSSIVYHVFWIKKCNEKYPITLVSM